MYYQPSQNFLPQVQQLKKILSKLTRTPKKLTNTIIFFKKNKVKTFLHSKVNSKFSFVGLLAELLISIMD